MASMSYCLFENTLGDLMECLDQLGSVRNEYDAPYRIELIEVCKEIVEKAEGLDFDKIQSERVAGD